MRLTPQAMLWPRGRLPGHAVPIVQRETQSASCKRGNARIVSRPGDCSKKRGCKFMETKITKIRTIRKRKGWTQTRLAERSGVSANYIALLERGKKTPSLKLLSRIAEALEVKVSSIFENDLQKDLEELKRQYNTQELSEAIKHFANGLK